MTCIEHEDESGAPDSVLSAEDVDELKKIIRYYDQSIQLNDTFDEALRGRARLLRLLALAPRSESTADDQNALLGAAYESAKAASFATKDRNPVNLEARAKIEIDLAYSVGANMSVEYFGQAADSYRQAVTYSGLTQQAALYNSIIQTDSDAAAVLQNAAAQDDLRFMNFSRKSEAMAEGVKLLWEQLPRLSGDKYKHLAQEIVMH